MKYSESIKTLGPALLAVQRTIEPIKKDSLNPHFKNRYASLEAVTDYLVEIINANGLVLMQGCTEAVHGVAVETTLLHAESGEWASTMVNLPLDKENPQGAGSAITYGRRYGLLAFFAVSTEDDDGQSASARPTTAPPLALSRKTTDYHNFAMPMGKSKGKKLSDLDVKDLESAVKWAIEKEKFPDFVTAAEQELESRGAESLDFDGAYA